MVRRSRASKALKGTYLALVLAFLYIPIVVMIALSFNKSVSRAPAAVTMPPQDRLKYSISSTKFSPQSPILSIHQPPLVINYMLIIYGLPDT